MTDGGQAPPPDHLPADRAPMPGHMTTLLRYMQQRKPLRRVNTELTLEAFSDEAMFMLSHHVIPSAARNPYDGSSMKLHHRDSSAQNASE